MVCLLYRDWLCFAIADKSTQTYTLQACLPLCSCNLEEADNGRGLQCHTAPFSWKLVFECDYQLYEIVMTACSPREEWEWRRRLDQNAADEECTLPEIQDFSFLALNIKTLVRSLESREPRLDGCLYGGQRQWDPNRHCARSL